MPDSNFLNAANMIRTDKGTIVDSDTLLRRTRSRIQASIRDGYQYDGIPNYSDNFLRRNVFKRFDSVVLYVDLVGSTKMALGLPDGKLAVIMSSFAQEMAIAISAHQGLVLKFMGDAVIGYFVATDNPLMAADRSVSCAKSMLRIINQGINPILSKDGYPELQIKIGLDYGTNVVVRYGQDPDKAYVDLMGLSMNMASKIQSMAAPDQILVGEDVYRRLHPSTKDEFDPMVWDNRIWAYQAEDGEMYGVYEYVGGASGITDI